MAGNKSDEINFQQYVDGVKKNKLSWQFFIAVMQDLSYSDIKRLRIVNAILMTELTMNYSDMDKQKYLNEMTNTDTFFSWVPVRRSVTGMQFYNVQF